MLKQRLLTAAILIPLVVWGILSLSTPIISWILALFVLVGGWEWARLIGFTAPVTRLAYALLVATVLWLTQLFVSNFESAVLIVLLLSGFWWLVGSSMVFRYRGEVGLSGRARFFGGFIGLLVLVPTWLALVHLHGYSQHGPALVLFLMVLIWGADSGAYFVGRKWGKRKLAPHVSPGKSIEGVAGGMATSVLIALMGMVLFEMPLASALWFIPLCFVVALFSVMGDLFESLFKRRAGVKDSGQLLPGHGGVLDRIDSLTTAAPIFTLGLILLGGAE